MTNNQNLNTFHMVGVFGSDSRSELPVDDLVAEALLNGFEEDIEEIFKRYAQRKGLDF